MRYCFWRMHIDRRIVAILSVLLLLFECTGSAGEMIRQPTRNDAEKNSALVIQQFGYAGNLAAGLSLQSDEGLVHFIGLWGTVLENSHSLWTLKFNLHPFSTIAADASNGQPVSWEPFYFGLGVLAMDCIFSSCDKDRVFCKLPEKYPDGYYAPTGYAIALNMGTELISGRTVLYAELVITLQGLDALYHNWQFFQDNYDYWGLAGVASLGIGLKWYY